MHHETRFCKYSITLLKLQDIRYNKSTLNNFVLYFAALKTRYDPVSPTEGKMARVYGTVVIAIFACLLVGIVLLDIVTMPRHIQLFKENVRMFRHSFVVQWCNRVSECIADIKESENTGNIHGTVEIELKEGTDS